MPLKIIVGITRKLGQPDYGSIAATCNAEVELPLSQPQDDLNAFQRHVRNAYVACEKAVDAQLAECQANASGNGHGESRPRPQSRPEPTTSRQNGNGHRGNGNGGRPVTEKQLNFIRQLAGRIKGLGARRLETLADTMFGKPVAELTSLDASGLIDTLKAVQAGEVDLQDALSGAAP